MSQPCQNGSATPAEEKSIQFGQVQSGPGPILDKKKGAESLGPDSSRESAAKSDACCLLRQIPQIFQSSLWVEKSMGRLIALLLA